MNQSAEENNQMNGDPNIVARTTADDEPWTQLREHDYVLGRGKPTQHVGNINFRELINRYKPNYQQLKTNKDKQEMAEEVMKEWRRSGGRFLKAVFILWIDVGNDEMKKTVKQKLREQKTSEKKKKAKAKKESQEQNDNDVILLDTSTTTASTQPSNGTDQDTESMGTIDFPFRERGLDNFPFSFSSDDETDKKDDETNDDDTNNEDDDDKDDNEKDKDDDDEDDDIDQNGENQGGDGDEGDDNDDDGDGGGGDQGGEHQSQKSMTDISVLTADYDMMEGENFRVASLGEDGLGANESTTPATAHHRDSNESDNREELTRKNDDTAKISHNDKLLDEEADSSIIQQSRDILQNAINNPESKHNIVLLSKYISHCTRNLADSHCIGGGKMYGKVYLAKDRQLATPQFAVKVFDLSNIPNLRQKVQELQSLKNEASILKRFRHPNIINFYCTCELSSNVFAFVTEYANKGSLDSFLKDDTSRAHLTADTRISIMSQLARAIHFLHTEGQGHTDIKKVFHRDIKPSNICLTDNNYQVKLIDFRMSQLERDSNVVGTSKLHSTTTSFGHDYRPAAVGTHGYRCPIYEQTKVYSEGCDVFSLGVVFAELIVGCLQDGQAERNGKTFGLMYETYVKKNEDKLVVDGHEKLVEDADTAIEWISPSLEKISKLAVECMAPTIQQRKTTLDLVNELNHISPGRETMSDDEKSSLHNLPDMFSSLSLTSAHVATTSDATEDKYLSHCSLCHRNVANKLKCSEGHEMCRLCATEHIHNHWNEDGDEGNGFVCCIPGCKSKPFSNEELRNVLDSDTYELFASKKSNRDKPPILPFFKPIIQEELQGSEMTRFTRSVKAFNALTVKGSSDSCPNLVWMVPSNKNNNKRGIFKQNPMKRLLRRATFNQTFQLAFICQHSWKFAHKPFEITVPRDWVVKVAPLLEISLIVLKESVTVPSQDDLFPSSDIMKFRENIQDMQEFVDSIISESERMRIGHAIDNMDVQTQHEDMLGDDDLCNIIEDGLKRMKEKVNETKYVTEWSDKIVAVPCRKDGYDAVKWVKKEYEELYSGFVEEEENDAMLLKRTISSIEPNDILPISRPIPVLPDQTRKGRHKKLTYSNKERSNDGRDSSRSLAMGRRLSSKSQK